MAADKKIAPKLKVDYLNLKDKSNQAKMRVPPAEGVISREVASAIRYLIQYHNFDPKGETTAFVIEKYARWYEIVQCRSFVLAFDSTDPKKNQGLQKDLETAMEIICSMKMSPKKGEGQHPNQKGMALTTINAVKVVALLFRKGLKVICLGFICSSDAVENFFSVLRGRNPAPTPLQCTYGIRVISFCQIKSDKHGNCRDDSDGWLQQLDKLHEMVGEDQFDDLDFEYKDIIARDFAEENALTNALGVVLRRTICSQSHCDDCVKAFTDDAPTLAVHCLTDMKSSYSGKEGALIIPSDLAYGIFVRIFENYFEANWEKLQSPNAHDQFLDCVLEKANEVFSNAPTCHLRLILQRVLKFRTIFKANGLNKEVVVNRKRVIGDAQASKSMVGYYVNK